MSEALTATADVMHPAVAGHAASSIDAPLRFNEQLIAWQERTQRALSQRLPAIEAVPSRLHDAMRYSVLGAGKRVRPVLVFATAAALGVPEEQVEAAACAIELIHAYSLVHDDLPAMDNDDLRRGRPTCHRAYDEATAILVGDALQPLAFEILANDSSLPGSASVRLQLVSLLAEASGSLGMAGGQAIDLDVQGKQVDLATVELMHARKTGALIRVSVMMAAACAPWLDAAMKNSLATFANAIGLAFQIQDDLLDVTGDTVTLGKTAGADQARGKPTFPAVAGVAASRDRLQVLHARASAALEPFGARAQLLRECSEWLLARRS